MKARKKERMHKKEEGKEMRIIINDKFLLIVRDFHVNAIETYRKKGERNRRKRKKKKE